MWSFVRFDEKPSLFFLVKSKAQHANARRNKCDILFSVTVSLAFHLTLVDFVSYWMEYNQRIQVQLVFFLFSRLSLLFPFSHAIFLLYLSSTRCEHFPITALSIVNNDVDDASVNHKSNSRVSRWLERFFLHFSPSVRFFKCASPKHAHSLWKMQCTDQWN